MTIVRFVVIAAGLGFLVGCSSSQPQGQGPENGSLAEVHGLLQAAAGAAHRPPASVADLERQQSLFPQGYTAVKSGDIVVLWGTPLKGEGEIGKDEMVLAYEKAVPTDGGYVLLSAGTVKKMTAAEFTAAPKSTKK